MKRFNLSKGTLYFPLKTNETVVNGAAYEIVNGKAQKVANTGATGELIGICQGGDNVRDGFVMLDIDPTAVFTETYSGDAPTLGGYVLDCKLVVNVDTTAKTFDYVLKKKSAEENPVTYYAVTFDVDGGTTVPAQAVADGEKATEPTPDPTKTGYTFGGWYKDALFATEFDFTTEVIEEATTIYAKWTEELENDNT